MKNKNTTTNNKAERLLTRREVADYFSVCKETVRRWEKSGEITPLMINARVYRYRMSDVIALGNS